MTADPHGQAFWDARYASRERIWSGEPNPQLVAEAASLPPGRALDMGCGEGADALWLAGRGWRVTAVDVSAVALARAAERDGAVDWQQADVRTWSPPRAAYDLVSAQFLHPAPDVRPGVIGRLAAAVAPGGVLLYVGHDPADIGVVPRGRLELMPAVSEIAQLLDGGEWDVEVAEARPRPGRHPEDGRAVTHHDGVVRARRR